MQKTISKSHKVFKIPSYRALRLLFWHRNQYRSPFIRRIRYYFIRLGLKRLYDHGGAGYVFEFYELFNKKRIEELQAKEMYEILDTIRTYLPSTPNTTLDVGAGLGGIDLTLYHHFDSKPTLYLLDKEGVSPDRHGGYHVSAKDFPHYHSFKATRGFLEANGVPKDKIKTIDIETSSFPTEKFDLVISLLSWGFHFSVDTYIEDVYKQLNKGGRLIIDLRKGTDGAEVLEKIFNTATTVLHTGRDFIRVGIEKTA